MKKAIALLLVTVLLSGILCVGATALGEKETTVDIPGLEAIGPYAPASVFLEDNLWIVLAAAVIAAAAIAVIVKKRKKNGK